MLLGKLSVCSCLYQHILLIMKQIILITILKKRQQKDNTVNRQTYLNSPRMPFEKGKYSFATCTLNKQLYVNYCGLTKMRFNLLLSRGSTACDVSRVQRIITFLQYIIKRFDLFFCVGSEILLSIMNRNSMKV